MNALFLIVALAVITKSVTADTCDACMTTYDAAKTAAGDDAAKCAATLAAATCLIAASGDGCDTGDHTAETELKTSGLVFTDAGAASCATTAICTCQGAYYTAVANRVSTTTTLSKCTEAMTYRICVAAAASTVKACDESTSQADTLTAVDNLIPTDCNFGSASGIVVSITAMCLSLMMSLFKF